jgi:hypothetical protein
VPIRAPNLTLTAANGGSGSTCDCNDTTDNDNGETVTRKIVFKMNILNLQHKACPFYDFLGF